MRGSIAVAFVASLVVVPFTALAQETNAHPASPATVRSADEVETALLEILERLDVLGARIRELEESQGRLIDALRELTAEKPPDEPENPGENHSADSEPIRPVVDGELLEEEYREALLLQAQGRIDDAIAGFEKVYEADPDGDLADNALYWLGEIRYQTRDFQSAIKVFERLMVDYPDGNRSPDAMYRVGLCYTALGDLLMARGVFERLAERYPYSTAAASARSRLENTRY